MPTKTTTLEEQIEANREALEQSRETAASLKEQVEGLSEAYQEAQEEGRRAASENHERWLQARQSDTGGDTKRQRSNTNSHRADQMEIAEAPIRRMERAEKILRKQYREARAHVADLVKHSWELERRRVREEAAASNLDEREKAARESVEDAQATLEDVQAKKRLLEGAENRAARERFQAQRMARALRSGEADSDGFSGVR